MTQITTPHQVTPAAAKPVRRVVTLNIPGLIGGLIGEPGWSGLAAFREHKSDVVEDLLLTGLAVEVGQ